MAYPNRNLVGVGIRTPSCIALLFSVSCTFGLEQEFAFSGGFSPTQQTGDTLFELHALGGNEDEAIEHYRLHIDEIQMDGSADVTDDSAWDLVLVRDNGMKNVVEPGDILHALESTDAGNFTPDDVGKQLWISVMVLAPSQRRSGGIRYWQTVWSRRWVVGE